MRLQALLMPPAEMCLIYLTFFPALILLTQADSFPVAAYGAEEITAAFASIHARYPTPEYAITVAIFNAGHGVWKPFLQVTTEDVRQSNQVNIEASFAFARAAILAFQENDATPSTGKKGTLVFTGATASLRGNVTTSAFASGKFAVRALSQSLAKEFGKEDIHVSAPHNCLPQYSCSILPA
jgi:NAD(P)-dependent dehydrogenase (short-subunit alcohol dehydrogenase family)